MTTSGPSRHAYSRCPTPTAGRRSIDMRRSHTGRLVLVNARFDIAEPSETDEYELVVPAP